MGTPKRELVEGAVYIFRTTNFRELGSDAATMGRHFWAEPRKSIYKRMREMLSGKELDQNKKDAGESPFWHPLVFIAGLFQDS